MPPDLNGGALPLLSRADEQALVELLARLGRDELVRVHFTVGEALREGFGITAHCEDCPYA